MVSSGICVFFIPLVRDKWQNLGISCLFGAVSTVGWNSLDVLSTELFPTNVRYIIHTMYSKYCMQDYFPLVVFAP